MATSTFQPARHPANEAMRLRAVNRSGLMGSVNTDHFDFYTGMFRHIAEVPVSHAGLLDDTRQYFLSENFTGSMTGKTEVVREETVCQYALLDTKPYVVNDLRIDPVFHNHPLVTNDPHWVFWAGFPIVTREGHVLGTICAVDFEPRHLDQDIIDRLSTITANLALFIQMQTDQQEMVARKSADVLTALEGAGVANLTDARAFLKLCMGQHLDRSEHDGLIKAGLAISDEGSLKLTSNGNALKTGQGLGPAEYKSMKSLIHDFDMLEEMFDVMDDEDI